MTPFRQALGAAVALGLGAAALPAHAAPASAAPSVAAPLATGAGARAAFTQTIPGSTISFDMVPLPGGTFTMGSPAREKGRNKDEGPQRQVTLRPFFMGKHEVTWDAYHLFLDLGVKNALKGGGVDEGPDALSYPTPPYADETFGYGRGKQPNIAVTWHAAAEFARWIARTTGKNYRLPTEAEWEYACRAGTDGAYSFGDGSAKLGDNAWFTGNAGKKPHVVGGKLANPFGLHDMHGNVAEWVIDRYAPDAYTQPIATLAGLPVVLPGEARYPHVARGGGWKDKPAALRCAARRFSQPIWSKQDPQTPQSIWWHTETTDVGFRLVQVPDEYPALKSFRSKMTMESANK
jgi:formylglycine-generating enzyme required for sulfatase activity